MDTTFDTIRRIARDTLHLPDAVLLRATTLNEAGIDSLATIDLVFAVESYYGIHIAADELAGVRSLRDFAVIAERLISRQVCHYEAPYEA